MPRRNRLKAIRRPVQQNTCTSKRAFASQAAAKRAIEARHDVDAALRCYFCTTCGKWHLTSQQR